MFVLPCILHIFLAWCFFYFFLFFYFRAIKFDLTLCIAPHSRYATSNKIFCTTNKNNIIVRKFIHKIITKLIKDSRIIESHFNYISKSLLHATNYIHCCHREITVRAERVYKSSSPPSLKNFSTHTHTDHYVIMCLKLLIRNYLRLPSDAHMLCLHREISYLIQKIYHQTSE